MKNLLRGKSMWDCVTSIKIKLTDKKATDYVESLDALESNNQKIITWINNFVMHLIAAQLAKFETVKEVWDHLA